LLRRIAASASLVRPVVVPIVSALMIRAIVAVVPPLGRPGSVLRLGDLLRPRGLLGRRGPGLVALIAAPAGVVARGLGAAAALGGFALAVVVGREGGAGQDPARAIGTGVVAGVLPVVARADRERSPTHPGGRQADAGRDGAVAPPARWSRDRRPLVRAVVDQRSSS